MLENSNFFLLGIIILLLQITIALASIQSRLKFFQYCTYYNYPVQQHFIRTQDNVTLKFFRIQQKNTTIQSAKKVVYLQHGLIDSSDTFIMNDQDKAPAFVLANKGYDVWLGNIRGNRYSNAALSSKVKDYWEFSFDELAKYDLTASFKYIANKTQQKINYIGHSQGTLIMFIALSMKYPHIQENLQTYSALGPIAYLNYMDSKILNSLMNSSFFQILHRSGDKILLYMTDSQLQTQSVFCKYRNAFCGSLLYDISDKNNSVNNLDRMPVISGHYPAGTSLKNFRHFQQFFKSGQFKMFDYGHDQNLKTYGTPQPPKFNISNINFPVHMFVGKYDRLATMKDAQQLYKELVNSKNKVIFYYRKTFTELDFGHATFIWGKNMSFLDKVASIIEDSYKIIMISQRQINDLVEQ